MYLEYYGLKEKPFTITPNPRFVFLSRHHREVFAHLLYGVRHHAGFIEVTGEVGTGKTTVLRSLFGELEQEGCRFAYIFNPCLSATELLRTINREFGLDDTLTPSGLHGELNAFLLRENAAGRTAVLVIDEAQNLEPSVLEQVRLLSNLETETDKLIQIILVGQPELGELLARSELRQLNQRITVRYHLQPMSREDTVAYIQHRLGVAGWTRGPLFEVEALAEIYRRAQGNPRLTNILCDRALLVGYVSDGERITSAMVKRAAAELKGEGGRRFPLPRPVWLTALLPLAIAGVWIASYDGKSAAVPEVRQQEAAVSVDRVRGELVPSLAARSRQESAAVAAGALMKLWGGAVVGDGLELEDLLNRGRDRGFEVGRISGDLTALRQLNLPVVLELLIGEEKRYVALVASAADRASVVAANGAVVDYPWAQLEPLWSRKAWFVWRNLMNIPVGKSPLRATDEILRLQVLLGEAGHPVERSGRYDAATSGAVGAFQRAHHLPADGIAGLQTLIGLYQAGSPGVFPRLVKKGGGE